MSEKRETAERAMLKRMIEGPHPFTFGQVHQVGSAAIGHPRMDHCSPAYRWADQLIQRERRAGRIKQQSRGKWVPA